MSGEQHMVRTQVVGIKLAENPLVPVVIVKAAGAQAQQLITEAQNSEIPVLQVPGLVTQLYRIPIDQVVTPDLFPVMAALLAHVIQVDKQHVEESAT